MSVSVFPSGGRPDACRDGHPWRGGTVIIGWMPCRCRNTSTECRGHVWVSCQYPGCSLTFYDPPHHAPSAQQVS